MAAEQLLFREDAGRALKRGVDQLADAVETTLGPKGRNVALDQKYGAPTVTHDGVTVAKDVELSDRFENMGAQLPVEAGIIDPARVTRSALENAASIAGMILTTEALVTEIRPNGNGSAAPSMPDY